MNTTATLEAGTAGTMTKTPWTQVVLAVGKVTFREILQDKLLYNIFLFAALVFGIGFLAATLMYGQPERIVLDFGMSGIAASCGMIAVLAGSSLLHREVERRTIHVALSRPISRPAFLLGKYLGLAQVIALNWLLLTVALVCMVAFFASISGVSVGAVIGNPTFLLALLYLMLQSLALGSMACFFSSFSTPSVSVIINIGLYLIGSNISELRLAAEKAGDSSLGWLVKAIAATLPEFERFAAGMRVTYALPIANLEALGTILYGLLMIAFFLLGASLVLQKREV